MASKTQPVLLGGLLIGVLSALPVVSMGNCLCCAWVVLGGVMAVSLLQQSQSSPVSTGDGALVGMLAGLVGAVVGSLLAIPIQMLMGPMAADTLQQLLERGDDVPPQVRDLLAQVSSGGVGWALALAGFVVNLLVNAIFGALGGLLGTVLFKPSTPPPPPPVPGFADPDRPHTPDL